jgi:hypothetical protein
MKLVLVIFPDPLLFRNVAGSIPDGVIGINSLTYSFR